MIPIEALRQLAKLIFSRNEIDKEISAIIGRPAEKGHIGEFIAAQIFDIELATSASNRGHDGVFRTGPLSGCTVNVKLYSSNQGILDINPDIWPDYYLVLAGPRKSALSSKGCTLPLVVAEVYLFQTRELIRELSLTGSKLGVATSVRRELWDKAQIYPHQANKAITLTSRERELIQLFGDESKGVNATKHFVGVDGCKDG